MKSSIVISILVTILAILGWVGVREPRSAVRDGIELPADAQATCVVRPAVFADWFIGGKVSRDAVGKPAASDSFPDGPNGDFYEWAWQQFLWLNSPAKGGGHIFHAGDFYGMTVPDTTGHQRFLPPAGPGEEGVLRVMQQGQPQGGEVLMARTGSLVYYNTLVNAVFAYYVTGTANGDIRFEHFPVNRRELNQIISYGRAHGARFPDSIALALEIKTSWVEAKGLPDTGGYVLADGIIPVYEILDSANWVHKGERRARLAMVGMHITGSVSGHPGHSEMIWATFEHRRNTPNAAYAYVDSQHLIREMPQDTRGYWLFCDKGARGPFNEARMAFSFGRIMAVGGGSIGPSNTMRMKPWGSGSDNAVMGLPAINNTEVISINNSVRGQLAADDVRRNYVLIGATWTRDGEEPKGPFSPSTAGNERGTNYLMNSTMETYHQENEQFGHGFSCFVCHSNGADKEGLTKAGVSHAFEALWPLFGKEEGRCK